ncbi:MAG: acetyl-CoA carboxylase biotin carboxyl carrier protein subunit [candidate division Zixibacteria bacterium]
MSRHEFVYEGDLVAADLTNSGDSFTVVTENGTVELTEIRDGLYRANLNGRQVTIAARFDKDKCYVDIDSVLIELTEGGEDSFAGGSSDHGGAKDKVFAPMPGKVVKLLAKVGDSVEKKQALVIVEAMKMENQVLAQAAGKVVAVNFSVGDQVDTETEIIQLELLSGE